MTEATHSKKPGSGIGGYIGCVIGGISLGVLGTVLFSRFIGGDDPVVAKYSGKSIRASEAFRPVKTRLFEAEEELYRIKEQAINDLVEQKLLETESKKANLAVDQLVEKELGAATGDISDKAIEEFLSSKGLSLNDPRIRKDDVRDYLKFRERHEKRQTFVSKLKSKSGVAILLKEPESPKLAVNVEGYPTWGNSKAPVTVVEFSDYQCPFCSRAIPVLDKIKQEYGPDKVRIVFRDMPLPSHPRANFASLAAHCANEQGKFWEYHDILFKNQTKLEDVDLKQYAGTLGLESAKFNECLEKKKYQGLIDQSKREAEVLGIQATPSFVINGSLIQGAQPFEKFKEKIDRASKRG